MPEKERARLQKAGETNHDADVVTVGLQQSFLEALTGQSCAQRRLSIHLRQTDVFRLHVALHALLHVRRRLEWHWSNVRALETQDFESF